MLGPVPGALQKLVTAGAVTGFALGVGLLVTAGDDGTTSTTSTTGTAAPHVTPTSLSTPLADFETTGLAVQRAAFCDLVPQAALAAALGGPPEDSASYVDGQRAAVTASLTDVAQEYDCTWSAGTGKDQATARAWVFAPPISPQLGTRLAREQVQADGCRRLHGSPAYGDPSAATLCRTRAGREVSYRGLFGDAWLSCSVTGGSGLADRVDPWCVAVAQAASAPAG